MSDPYGAVYYKKCLRAKDSRFAYTQPIFRSVLVQCNIDIFYYTRIIKVQTLSVLPTNYTKSGHNMTSSNTDFLIVHNTCPSPVRTTSTGGVCECAFRGSCCGSLGSYVIIS